MTKSDFMDFILEFDEQFWEDFDDIEDAEQLQAPLKKWCEPTEGILARVKDNPVFACADDAERKIFRDYFAERLRTVKSRFGLKPSDE